MKAKSIKGNSPQEVELALKQGMADGFNPVLAIVFLSIKQDRDAICSLLDQEGISIFGATTAGEFIDGDIGKGTIAILLLDINRTYFQVLYEEVGEGEPRTVARQMGDHALQFFRNPAFIVCGSGLVIDGEIIIRGIEDAAGPETTLWGGMAGDDFIRKVTYVFTNGKSNSKGIVMLVFDSEKIMLKGKSGCGWKPAGTVKTITRSEGRWIYTIDDQPALDMIIKFMGITETRKEKIDLNHEIAVNYAVAFLRESGFPVMRSVMYINWDDKSLMVNGQVEQGSKIRLTLPPDFEVMDSVIEESEELKTAELPDADAVIMFSCMGRLLALGPLIGKEIEGVRNTFNAPLAGFFTYGEFGRATGGNNEYHNLTCCWVAIKEN